jgi:hypothetical protein
MSRGSERLGGRLVSDAKKKNMRLAIILKLAVTGVLKFMPFDLSEL